MTQALRRTKKTTDAAQAPPKACTARPATVKGAGEGEVQAAAKAFGQANRAALVRLAKK